MPVLEELMRREDVMKTTRLSWTTLWREITSGRLRSVKVGARILFRPADVAAWVESRTRPQAKKTRAKGRR